MIISGRCQIACVTCTYAFVSAHSDIFRISNLTTITYTPYHDEFGLLYFSSLPKIYIEQITATLILVTASSTIFFLGLFLRRLESSSTSTDPRKERRNTAAGAAYTPEYGPSQPHYGNIPANLLSLSHTPNTCYCLCL